MRITKIRSYDPKDTTRAQLETNTHFYPSDTATNNICQRYNCPEYQYQYYWSGIIYNSIEFEVCTIDVIERYPTG